MVIYGKTRKSSAEAKPLLSLDTKFEPWEAIFHLLFVPFRDTAESERKRKRAPEDKGGEEEKRKEEGKGKDAEGKEPEAKKKKQSKDDTSSGSDDEEASVQSHIDDHTERAPLCL